MYEYGVRDLFHLEVLNKNCTKLIRFCLLLDFSKVIYTCHTVKRGGLVVSVMSFRLRKPG